MSVRKEPSGRRSIQVEVEVPGTPEEVWQAIATGPGVSAWFVPVDIEHDENGKAVRVVSHLGPGMDSVATPTSWNPPHSFSAEANDLGPGAPAMATEWIVEARSGGTCIVRVVHSLFADTGDWDDQLDGLESGWPGFFRVLSLYMTYFRGQSSASLQLMGVAGGPESDVWSRLTAALNLSDAVVGERRDTNASSSSGTPPLAGVVEHVGEGKHPSVIILRIDRPAPGVVSAAAHTMGENVYVVLSMYLYGEGAAEAVAREEPRWRAWLQQHFPMPLPPFACSPE